MDNEPTPPPSPNPPMPDLTPPPSPGPPPPSMTPPPSAPPPPPPGMMGGDPAPKPKISVSSGGPAEDESELPPAGSEAPFNPRFLAGIVDCLIAGGLQIMVHVILPHFMSFLAWVLGLGYILTRDALPFLNGQSLGKKAMKLRAVTQDGKSLTNNWQTSAIRSLSLAIPVLGLVDAFILWQKSQQNTRLLRLGDEWAKTKVIVAEDDPTPPPAA